MALRNGEGRDKKKILEKYLNFPKILQKMGKALPKRFFTFRQNLKNTQASRPILTT